MVPIESLEDPGHFYSAFSGLVHAPVQVFVRQVVQARYSAPSHGDEPRSLKSKTEQKQGSQEEGDCCYRSNQERPFFHVDDVFIILMLEMVRLVKLELHMVDSGVIPKPPLSKKERARVVQDVFVQPPLEE